MKVILIQHLPSLGQEGEVKEVADGYARNFLLPKKIAIPATQENLANLDRKLKALHRHRLLREQELKELASKLEGLTLQIQVRTGKEGKLYGAVTAQRIVRELEKLAINLDRRQIELKHPIRVPGEYKAVVRLGGGLNPELKIIVREGGSSGEVTAK